MRGIVAAVLACVCMGAVAAPVAPTKAVESTGLRSIAGWLKAHGAKASWPRTWPTRWASRAARTSS